MFRKKHSSSIVNQSERSFIAETMQIEGEVSTSGSVDVAGLVKGNANVREMIIFETGSIKGNVFAAKIEINGHVEGQVEADEVTLGSNAVVMGDISFKKFLKTEEGAEIDGYIKGNKIQKTVRDEYKDIEKPKHQHHCMHICRVKTVKKSCAIQCRIWAILKKR